MASGSMLTRRLRTAWQLGRPWVRPGDDLSKIQGPGLCKQLQQPWRLSPEDWQACALNEAQLQQFHDKGYVAGIPVLKPAECDALSSEVDRLLTCGSDERWYAFHPFVASGAWRMSAAFHDLCWMPGISVPAYQLLGGPVRFLHDQIFCKPPRARGPSWFGFHQDYYYWSWTKPMAHLTCWVALDDITAENGCLQYVPGSHRWGLLPSVPEGAAPTLDAVKEVLSQERRSAVDSAERVILRRGQASFHHPLLLHGSGSNLTAAPRRAAVVNLVRDGVRSNCEAEPALLGKFPFVPQGRAMGRAGHESDRMFPLLHVPEGSDDVPQIPPELRASLQEL